MNSQQRPSISASIRRDVGSAYIASATRIGVWFIVSALVYRILGPGAFAMLALVRGTTILLNYTLVGLAPAMIRLAATPGQIDGPRAIYSNGAAVALAGSSVGLLLTLAYALLFDRLHIVPSAFAGTMTPLVIWMGLGMILRLLSEPASAALQARGDIAADNVRATLGELSWLAITTTALLLRPSLVAVGLAYAASGLLMLILRTTLAHRRVGALRGSLIRPHILGQLLTFGGMVMLAQLADFLYAPTDFILINRLLSPLDVAHYAPAIQIDAGLALLITGLASVLLPRTAAAHASGDAAAVRRYYLRGTALSMLMLLPMSLAIWLLSPWIFLLWLGDPMPQTQAILPLVLLHNLIGGSGIVGRSILLGIGRVRPFTIAVLLGGITNVILSYIFVRHFGLGLQGIVLGTIVSVSLRAGLWMPWYVLRSLRSMETLPVHAP